MRRKIRLIYYQISILAIAFFLSALPAGAHEIYFCGEAIPTSRDFVANKLMNTIRDQIPNVTLAELRYKSKYYFPYIVQWLRKYNIPEDFKYIPIVECGFRNLQSSAGARGFWQLMPEVAKQYGLTIMPGYDERDIPVKATQVACLLIRDHYKLLKSRLNVSSWVLTAAAYNFGPGNVLKNVQRQGTDYFSMSLNQETADYVYRLIAVKELFEHPEIYMKGFNKNIFNTEATKPASNDTSFDKADKSINTLEKGEAKTGMDADFNNMEVKVSANGAPLAPDVIVNHLPARLVRAKKKFHDGSAIYLTLGFDLRLSSGTVKKGGIIKGNAWIIDGRVLIDLGYGTEVEVLDKTMTKGITEQQAITEGEVVVLRTYRDRF